MAEGKTGKSAGKGRPGGAARKNAATLEARIIDAALALAAKRPWGEVTLADIAAKAGVGLGELVAACPSRLNIISAVMARIDAKVLDGLDPDLAAEPVRERLLDILISRFEALAPHKAAVRSIARFLAHEPEAALALRRAVLRSQAAMLAGAGVETYGPGGAARALGLAFVYRQGLRVWLEDDDPGMARTMAEIDRRLRDGERVLGRLAGIGGAARIARSLCSALLERRRKTAGTDSGGAPAA